MAYVLLPEGFTIEKVTKAEQAAVDEYFGRKRRGSYFTEFLGNEATPKVLGAVALLASLPKLLSIILPLLSRQLPGIPDDAAELIDQTLFLKDLNEAIGEIIVPGGGIFFEGEAKDFYDKYVKR